jgi:uncharacterized protein YecT (DUF1311 family)
MRVVLAWAAAMVFAATGVSAAASFECSRAKSLQEKLICDNRQVSAADEALAGAYARALQSAADREGLKRQQQGWIRTERDACRDAPCLLAAYRTRIAALEGLAGQAVQQWLRDANARFTFRGEPINPRMLNDLLPWSSDTLAGPVAIDLDGGRNRYAADVTVLPTGAIRAVCREDGTDLLFQYERLGVLASGTHVLKVLSNAGGSLTSVDLLLVKFMADTEYGEGGRLRDRILMLRTGSLALGSGYDGAIEVTPNRIAIGPGGGGLREKAKVEVIEFR